MVIQHNLLAYNANRMYGLTRNKQNKIIEKLSSGYRINRAADDAAGLSISENLRRQIRGLNQGTENIQDGIGLIQVADGAMAEVHDMLQRMTELSVQAANGTNSEKERDAIQQEIHELVVEIDRIGKSTTFNGMPIFDDMYGEEIEGSVTKLVTSPAAQTGYLTEAIQTGPGKWSPSASIDFSNINSSNINKLNGQGFSFNCSVSCSEVFDIKFKTDGDGTQNSATNLGTGQRHKYVIDISECTSGEQIVNKIFSYVNSHQPASAATPDDRTNIMPGAAVVSHSNYFVKDPGNSNALVVYTAKSYSSEALAKTIYPKSGNPDSGRIDCSSLTNIVADEKINEIPIQCSAEEDDMEMIYCRRMNASIIGVSGVDVTSSMAARNSIDTVKNAIEMISSRRSEMGAMQNRLEHAMNSNRNVAENTTASESLLRDADMAKLMVEQSKNNILEQVGQSMLTQANQSKQGVMSLLQ